MAQETQTRALYQPRGVGWGGRWERGSKGIYVYLWLIHAEIWQKTIQFCKAIILQCKKLINLKKCQSHERVKKLRVIKRQRRQKEDAPYVYLKFRKRGKNEWGKSSIWRNNGWQFSEAFPTVKLQIQEAIQISSRIKFRIRRCGLHYAFIYTYFYISTEFFYSSYSFISFW